MKKSGQFEYSEELPCSGRLIVSPDDWHIYYVFSRPDLRYKIHTLKITSSEIESYSQALEEAWSNYVHLQKQYQLDQSSKEPQILRQKKGIYISVGYGHADGVSISANGFYEIQDAKKVNEILEGWQYAVRKAKAVMTMLKTVDNHLKKTQDKI